jgi:SAM-dependent methyltransferase
MTGGDPPLTARGSLRWAVVEPLLSGLRPASVLELGCGQGAVGARIARHAQYTGVEPDRASYDVAAARIGPRGGTVLHGDAGVLPWGRTYDVVCAFEVLEHIADDVGALRSWLSHLARHGHVVVSVPEGPERFGPSDVQVGHHRRYTEQSLRELLEAAGLQVDRVVYYGWPLGYLLERVSDRAASRAAESGAGGRAEPADDSAEARSAGSGRWLQPGAVTGAALRIGVTPFATLQGRRPGKGTGLVAVGRRPG